ncbi:hypothetical protein [Bythopirellula polymerisocia]|uniref:Uncharacterized protein n=1 Tax=Bythopirellula polymerisocia TaxID=2528003 RepID=A0A5C6CUZ8_9BACT|nr:hypothetical protein [Bythopirellula polymerisocia]TWU28410.1 hypothetical protein Pla144_16980 [Bythopirellula polymerisocia]
MADSSPSADLLDRASKVFGMANSLARGFQNENREQVPMLVLDESPREGHRKKISDFIAATLDLRDAIESPPEGFEAVAEQLLKACQLARILPLMDGWDLLDQWPSLNQIAFDGHIAVTEAVKAKRLEDPWAFLDRPPASDAEPAADADQQNPAKPIQTKSKRSTERGEGRAKLIAALTKYHKYADDGCLNLEPAGSNELARLAGVSVSTASAFFSKEFGGHTKYRAICADATSLIAGLKLLNQEFSPHDLYGGKPPGEVEREDDE